MHQVLFYQTAMGREIIKEWLRSFDKEDRAILGEDLLTVQLGFPWDCRCVPFARARPLGSAQPLTDGRREARMIFYYDADAEALVVLHGFIKTSQKTPKAEIDIALKRKREFPP